jgi:hypothetical protein
MAAAACIAARSPDVSPSSPISMSMSTSTCQSPKTTNDEEGGDQPLNLTTKKATFFNSSNLPPLTKIEHGKTMF